MDAVIPAGVVEHLRKLAEEQTADPFRGGFTVENYCDALGVSAYRARKDLRVLLRKGLVRARTIGLTLNQANDLGFARGCSTTVYYLTDKKP